MPAAAGVALHVIPIREQLEEGYASRQLRNPRQSGAQLGGRKVVENTAADDQVVRAPRDLPWQVA